ncbi:MAG: Holliday junction resolvase RuvX [Tannerella sp.]|nr:Holliday junction resolvase RuvX [Tannerella sp.]
MGRVMAIDYGRKRSGVAVTDRLQIIAGGLDTVPSAELPAYVKAYAEKEPIERIIIGQPKQMNNEASENAKYVEAFVNRLRKVLPGIPLQMYDERFTSVLAHRAMLEGGLKKKKRQEKALVDKVSAVIILQSWLESKKTDQ